MNLQKKTLIFRSIQTGFSLLLLLALVGNVIGAEIEEIIVTAQKIEQGIQDVPISIAAYSGERLEKAGISSTTDLQYAVPSLSVSTNNGVAAVYIRGIGSDAVNSAGDPSVAMHLDGVYIARLESLANTFYDLERVEILRGPQGTLYGRNAAGGSLNIITRKPEQENSGYASVAVGTHELAKLELAAGGGLSENLAGRVALYYLDRDGFTDNVGPVGPDTLDNKEVFGFRGALTWDFSETSRLLIVADYMSQETDGTSIKPLDDLSIAVNMGAMLPPGLHETTTNFSGPFDKIKSSGLNITFDKEFENTSIKWITGYREHELDSLFDSDGTDLRVVDLLRDQDQNQFTTELQLFGSSESLSWITGLFYFEEDVTDNFELMRSNIGFNVPIRGESKTEAWAAFAQATYQMTDEFSVTAGIRYSDEKKESFGQVFLQPILDLGDTSIQNGFIGGDYIPLGGSQGSADWSDVSPKLSLQYDFSDDLMAYVSFTQGFKSGGFNLVGIQPSFEPEDITAYETGLKGDFLDGSMTLALSAFYYDYKDLQVQIFATGTAITTNAAKASVTGAELEMRYLVTEGVTFELMASLLDATYDDYFTEDPQTGDPLDLSGNTLRNAPELSVSADLDYELTLTNGNAFRFWLQANYTSEVYFDQFNTVGVNQEGFTLINARLSYYMGDFEFALWGRNLTDEDYLNNAVRFDTTGYNAQGYPGNPREIGFETKYRF